MISISSSTQCEAYGGACALPADCADSSVLFHGSCGDNDLGCCITKDDLCAARNGTCLSSEECEGEEDKHASRMACSDRVCCVPNRAFPRMFGDCKRDRDEVGAGRPWNRPGHGRPDNYPGGRHRNRRPDNYPGGRHRGRRPGSDRRHRRPHGDRRNQDLNDRQSYRQSDDVRFDIDM